MNDDLKVVKSAKSRHNSVGQNRELTNGEGNDRFANANVRDDLKVASLMGSGLLKEAQPHEQVADLVIVKKPSTANKNSITLDIDIEVKEIT